MYAVYRATFDDGTEELVKAESWMAALGLVMSSWPGREVTGLTFARSLEKSERQEPGVRVDAVAKVSQ